MPSKSEKQRKFMGLVLSYKLEQTDKVSDNIKKVSDSMSVEQIKDFLEESINGLVSEESEYHKKYGRSKLFNISAMKELLSTNSFLNNVYEKMKIRGKEIFGYHYNEIILSFIFLKYIKTNKELFKKYLVFKKKATANIEKETEKQKAIKQGAELALSDTNNEVTESSTSFGTFGVDGIPATPSFLAKNKQNWGGSVSQVYKGSKVIKTKLENPKNYIVQNKMNENRINELLNGDYIINKNLNESISLTPNNIDITSINGIDPLQYLKKIKTDFADPNLDIEFVIDTVDSDETQKIFKLDFDEFLSYVRENWFKDQKIDDETLETEITYNMFQHYIIDNFDKITKEIDETYSKDVEPELKEHHIESRENITSFILNKTDNYTEDQLDDMDYDSLYKVYLDIESNNFPNTEKETEPNLIVGQNMNENKTTKDKIQDLEHIIKKEASKEKPDAELLKKLREDLEELKKENNISEIFNKMFKKKIDASETSDFKKNLDKLKEKLKNVEDKETRKKMVYNFIKNNDVDQEEKKHLYMQTALSEETELRSVKVHFENGDTINTNMAKGVSDEEIKDYYKVGKTFNLGNGDKDKLTKVKSVEILKENINIDSILNKLNEESQHPAITNLNRIKSENEKMENEYFKDLNKGIQDGIKDTDKGGNFEYEYDNLPKEDENLDEDKKTKEEVADGVKYKPTDAVEKFVKDNRGRTPYDLDFDIEPSKKWLETLKKNIGEDNYKHMLEKMKQRKLERRYQRDVETEINPDRSKEKINLTPNLPSLNETKEMFMMGMYKDVYGKKHFKRLDVSKASLVDTLNENLTEFVVKGMGNTKSSRKVVNENGVKEFEVLKEHVEVIDTYKFYIDEKTFELFKIKKNM